MNIVYWSTLAGLLIVQLVITCLAWRHLARRTRVVVGAWQRAASSDVPTSMLVTAMAHIEARLQQLENSNACKPSALPAGSADAYQHAQRMAQKGATAPQIAEACGITLGEAELLAHLHKPGRSDASPPDVATCEVHA